MTPKAVLTVNGTPVSGVFWERLISLTITDRDGDEADTIDMQLVDGDPFLAIPARGAKAAAALGYAETGTVHKGEFVIDEVETAFLPYTMSITGKATDVREKLKEQKERHFDNRSVGEIVSQIAGEHGLTAAVDHDVGAHRYEWIGQQDESDLHFLQRLARRHGALFAPKDGRLVFTRRDGGVSASGLALPPVIVTPTMMIEGTGRVRFSDRGRHKRVTAYFQDKGKQKRVEVEVESDPAYSAVHRLQEPFASEEEAGKAAQSKSDRLKASSDTTEVTIEGSPYVIAGAPLVYSGVRPGVDGIEWVIDTVTHSFSKAGYTTRISARRKPDGGGV